MIIYKTPLNIYLLPNVTNKYSPTNSRKQAALHVYLCTFVHHAPSHLSTHKNNCYNACAAAVTTTTAQENTQRKIHLKDFIRFSKRPILNNASDASIVIIKADVASILGKEKRN